MSCTGLLFATSMASSGVSNYVDPIAHVVAEALVEVGLEAFGLGDCQCLGASIVTFEECIEAVEQGPVVVVDSAFLAQSEVIDDAVAGDSQGLDLLVGGTDFGILLVPVRVEFGGSLIREPGGFGDDQSSAGCEQPFPRRHTMGETDVVDRPFGPHHVERFIG
jgi:hypothetical protein